MNILILNWRDVRHPKSGGAELVTINHAKEWVKKGHRVTWLTSCYSHALREETVDGIRILRRWGSLTIYLFAPWYLILNAHQYDVIVDEVHGIPFFSPMFTRKPVVVFIHEIAGDIWDFMYPFPVNKIGKVLEALYFRIYRTCLFWTDASSTVDELVARGIPREQCIAIPCPIVKSDISDPSTTLRVNKRQEIGKKEKEPTYLFVSRVVRMKGIEEVIKAFSFIVKEQPLAKLWIIGGGEDTYIQQLKAMMQEYGVLENVIFWGKVSDLKKSDLMSRAHILLHASVKEGWGLVVLEAADAGTPSVVYNVSGLRDVVKNGITGVVLSDNTPREMARDAVRLFLNHERYLHFQKNGKEWVKSLRWENVAKQSLSVLHKAVK
jgi:glycosyltransferase involved in cell wall biosynthesis